MADVGNSGESGMKDWIAIDDDDNVVGKWRQHKKPSPLGSYTVEEVEDVNEYSVDYWFEQP